MIAEQLDGRVVIRESVSLGPVLSTHLQMTLAKTFQTPIEAAQRTTLHLATSVPVQTAVDHAFSRNTRFQILGSDDR